MISILAYILFTFHALYISVTEIDFDQETNKLNISVKIFTNDLEDGIYNLSKTSISLRTEEQLSSSSSLIGQYIGGRMAIKLNGKNTSLKLLNSENEGDATWVYFEVANTMEITSIEIRNQILTELFATQSNVVSVDINGDKRFLRFSKGSEVELLNF